MTLDKLKTKRSVLKEILLLLLWDGLYLEHKTIGELEEDYKKGNYGLAESLNELQSYQYPQETNLGDLDKEYKRIDTAIHNMVIPKTITDNRVEVEEDFTITFKE